jgi:hypothetical protein
VAAAQAEPLDAGREARLYVRGLVAPFEGTLLSVRPTEVRIATPDGEMRIAPAQVVRSEVLGNRGNARRGAVVGLGVGLGVGVAWVVGSTAACEPGPTGACGIPEDRGEELRLAIPAVAGAALGALVGSQVRSNRWVQGFFPQVGASADRSLGLAWRIPVA